MSNTDEGRALYRWLNTQVTIQHMYVIDLIILNLIKLYTGDDRCGRCRVLKVMDYLYWYRDTHIDYLEKYKAYYGFSISFDMLIGGYTTKEVFLTTLSDFI